MDFQSVDLSSWDYLVADCGYVERLYKEAKNMIKQTKLEDDEDEGTVDEHALMFFINYDYNWKTEKTKHKCLPHQEDPDHVYDTLLSLIKKKKLGDLSAVCFKQGDWDVDLIEMLQKYRHCEGFGDYLSEVASFKTENGKRVLYKKFDTESG